MSSPSLRRDFIKRALAAGAATATAGLVVPEVARASRRAPGVRAFDHVALPMQNVDAMIAFYRALGFVVRESTQSVSVHFGDQKINFHRPALWQSRTFTLRAPAAQPPCGDLCWVWDGTADELGALIDQVGAGIVAEGERAGGRDLGEATGHSVYIRDPDGNLLEFIRYS